jgi:hypothetical protein
MFYPALRAFVTAALAVCLPAAFGQSLTTPTVPSPSEIKRAPIPLDHLYRLFLESQIAIDKSAVELQQQGRMGQAVSRFAYRQRALHFSDGQMAAVRQAADQIQKDKADLWTKAMPIMLQDREWRKLNGRDAGHPPGHAQVDAWQKENEAKLHQTIAQLNRRLGSIAAAQLRSHLMTAVSGAPPGAGPLIHLHGNMPSMGVQR